MTATEASDECGVIVVGLGENCHAYVLDDGSGVMPPDQWARAVVAKYREHEADKIIAEVNNGGDMIGLTINTVDQGCAYEAVRASRGKRTRAEPVASLYEQGRVHHVGVLPTLEDEMCTWDPMSSTRSPNRIDALVWAVWSLLVCPDDAFLQVMAAENEARRQAAGHQG